jgi:death-on-curing protein
VKQHGGALGLRDQGLLDSALQRAPNHWHYQPSIDLPYLAALYGVGLAQNHPFVDGNKRTAFQAMYVFLGLNGLRLSACEVDVVVIMREVASGALKEDDVASWIRENIQLS